MDIYDYLKKDHEKVAKLFKLFDSAQTEKNKLEIIAMIMHELTIHAESEEQSFYAELEKLLKDPRDVLHGEKEHQEIKQKISELKMASIIDIKTVERVNELKRLVEHHVREEEGKIFSEAKKVLSEDDAYRIKIRMHDLKGRMIVAAE